MPRLRMAPVVGGVFLGMMVLMLLFVVMFWSPWLGGSPPTPQDLFRRFALDPIPESVVDLKAEYMAGTYEYRATLAFGIAPADLAQIFVARPYRLYGPDSAQAQRLAKMASIAASKGWPHPAPDAQPEVYVCDDEPNTRFFCLMTNREHTRAFLRVSRY